MNRGAFGITGDSDATEVIPRVGPKRSRRSPDEPVPLWRRFTLLGMSFVAFLGTVGLMGYWAYANSLPGSVTPIGQSAEVFGLFVLATLAFGVALFKHFSDNRFRLNEKLQRDEIWFKHDETRRDIQAMHDETRRQFAATIDQHEMQWEVARRRNVEAFATMHQQVLNQVGVVIDGKMDRVMAEHDHILRGLLLLADVMPELLAQTEWVAYAKGIKAGLDGELPTGMDAPVRFPQQQPRRRPAHGALKAVPNHHSN